MSMRTYIFQHSGCRLVQEQEPPLLEVLTAAASCVASLQSVSRCPPWTLLQCARVVKVVPLELLPLLPNWDHGRSVSFHRVQDGAQ
jgi:hypothetical protein